MGVQGLTTFVDQNPHLLTDLQLHDTRVVIDGNNLFHFLYKLYGVSYSYGGDYNDYANGVDKYFKTLTSVGMQPFVVFDGCYDSDDKKLKTTLKRAQEKIAMSSLMAKGQPGKLIPVLASTVFRDVLVENDIPHVVCDEEADGEIATLANLWGCPVMSNDSDFYIYDLQHGFILFDYLNLEVNTEEDKNGVPYKYLHAQIYKLDNLLKSYERLTRESVPLLATLMGNDFVEQKHFDGFFKSANVTQGRRQTSTRRHYKMGQVLDWMNRHKGDLIAKVLECIPKDKREFVGNLIDFSLTNYTKVSNTSSAVNLFDTDSILTTTWKSFHGNSFPDWFVTLCREGKVYTIFMNALVLQKVISPSQVELSQRPSASDCALPIRQIVYSILLTLDNECESNSVTEYVREKQNLVKKAIPMLTALPNGVTIPHLKDLPSMDVNRKIEFFYHCLGISENLTNVPLQLKVFTALLIYFVQNVSPKVTKSFIYSIIISFLKLLFIDRAVEIEGYQYLSPKQQLNKYTKAITHNHAHRFDGDRVHCFSQFQACWLATTQLHHLLTLPEQLPAPALSLNGSFIYSLYSDLNGRAKPVNFIKDLLGRDSQVYNYFELISRHVFGDCSEDTSATSGSESAKKTKKSRKKGKRKPEHADEVKVESDSESSPNWEAKCDLSNKFSQLMKDT